MRPFRRDSDSALIVRLTTTFGGSTDSFIDARAQLMRTRKNDAQRRRGARKRRVGPRARREGTPTQLQGDGSGQLVVERDLDNGPVPVAPSDPPALSGAVDDPALPFVLAGRRREARLGSEAFSAAERESEEKYAKRSTRAGSYFVGARKLVRLRHGPDRFRDRSTSSFRVGDVLGVEGVEPPPDADEPLGLDDRGAPRTSRFVCAARNP